MFHIQNQHNLIHHLKSIYEVGNLVEVNKIQYKIKQRNVLLSLYSVLRNIKSFIFVDKNFVFF